MKHFVFGIGLVALCVQAFADQPSLQTMVDCELAGSQNTISLLRGSPIIDSHIYQTRYAQITRFVYEMLRHHEEAKCYGNVLQIKKM